MEEINEENLSNEDLDELEELPWKWSGKTSPIPWNDEAPLSEELRKLDEALKQQNDEARAWLDEEFAADEILRSEINELQIARQKNQNMLSLELQLPPEVKEKINTLEIEVRTLQDQIQEKSDKLGQSYEVYSEVLAKLNETNERVIANDNKFKQSLLKVKEEYAEVEAVLRGNLDTYKSLNKELQLQLNEKESELVDLRESKGNTKELEEQVKILQEKVKELTSSNESTNKYNLKLKAHLKKLKENEKESSEKEKQTLITVENLKKSISQYEEENIKLKEQCANIEAVEELQNRIALLEEEKGNLQLQLVDLDEIKEAADSTLSQFSQLEKDKNELEKKIATMQSENDYLEQNCQLAKNELLEQNKVMNKLQLSFQSANEEKMSAARKCVELEETLSMKVCELDQLKIQLASEKEIHTKETDFKTESIPAKEHLDKMDQLVNELSSKTGFIDSLQNDIVNLKQEIDSYKNLNDSISNQLEELKKTNSELSTQLKEKTKEGKQLVMNTSQTEADGKDLTQKYKQLAVNFKKKKQMCQDLEASVENMKKEILIINNEKSTLIEKLNDSLNQIQQFQNISKSSHNETLLLENINSLNTLLKDKENLITELELERDRLTDVVNGYEEEVKMIKELYEKELNQNKEYFTDLKQLEIEMGQSKTDLLSKLEDATSNYVKAIALLQEKDNYIATCEDEVTNLKAQVVSLESEVKEKQNNIDELFQKLKNAESHTKESIQGYKQEVESKLEVFKKNEEFFKNKIINLQVEYEDIKEIADATRLRNSSLEHDLQEAKATIDGISSELVTLRDTRDAYNMTLDKIEFLNGDLKETIESLEQTNTRIITLEQEREELNHKLNDLEDTCSDLENKLEEADNTIDKLEEDIKKKDKTLEEHKNEISILQTQLNQSQSVDIQNQLKQLSEEYEKKVNENISNSQHIQQLELSLNERISEIQFLQNSHQALEIQLKNIKEESDKEIQLFQTQKIFFETQLEEKIKEFDDFKNESLKTQNQEDERWKNLLSKPSQVQEVVEPKEEMSVFTWSDQGQSSVDNPFGELKDEEDGWGWMGGESQIDPEIKPEPKELHKKFKKLQEDYEQALSELETTKIKSQKYIKKIKEMKIQIENLERSKTATKADFNDLDFAVQEELRNENDRLTAKINEISTQMSSIKHERESFIKRIDTLTTANEHLVDMKERQDIEVQMWQRRSNELANQVQGLQWIAQEGSGIKQDPELAGKLLAATNELESTKKKLEEVMTEKYEIENKLFNIETPDNNINDLEIKINDLSDQNEKLKSELSSKNNEINVLIKDKNDLENKIKVLQETKESSPQVFQGFANTSDDFMFPIAPQVENTDNISLERQMSILKDEYEQILDQNNTLNKTIQDLNQKIQENIENIEFWKQKSEQLSSEITSKESSYHERIKEIEDYYQQTVLTKDEENSHLICNVSSREKALSEAQKEIVRLKESLNQFDTINNRLNEVVSENEILKRDLENLKQSLEKGNEGQIHQLVNQISSLGQTVDQLNHEIQMRQNEIQRLNVLCNEYVLVIQEKDNELANKNSEILNLQNYAGSAQNVQKDTRANEEIERLSQLVSESQIRLQVQTEQLEEKNKALSEAHNHMVILQESSDLKNAQDYNELRETLNFLEKEKTRLENLLQEKLSIVEQLEKENVTYKNQPGYKENTNAYANVIEQKDIEIQRLTDILKATRDTLVQKVQTEEARMSPYIRSAQIKLDQALYTVHQRDVKIEELNREIIQLLQERDTLQIKLSETMRAYDVLKNENTKSGKISQTVLPVSSKISELNFDYGKDPVIQKERETRHNEQMQLYQDTTLSEDPNPTMDYGIFNWFFGGSPQPQSESTELSS